MTQYRLSPASNSYTVGEPDILTENEVIDWATNEARVQGYTDPDLTLVLDDYDQPEDITLIFDNYMETIDIYKAIEILEGLGEFIDPY